MTDSNEPKERSMLASLLPVLASHSRRFVLASSRLICSSLCVLLCSPPSVALNFYLNRSWCLVLRHQNRHWYTYLVKLEEPHHQFSIYHNLMFGGNCS
ncbi:uncharacterized protein LOC110272107 isoform X2 [Arachis ipaensis]|uniref:uncharacterized protein LOC110272107 isoform X2 n=1 Tax=Arachis ipaensis TaxID=130454 RepID=UPI000A2B6791|nr:uncharacterized protein LOC110272107 isoform X2 [Arachis ipaensis]XP_029148607.1 uncharacterized protein LOC114925295 isoform X2 [Arachis hypogaea]